MSLEINPTSGLRPVPGRADPIGHRSAATFSGHGRLRLGVVGCGYWGAKHVRVLGGLGELSEVVPIDADPRILQGILASVPAARAFADLDAALPYVDAVVIATPPRTHAELALTAIRHGKHVLIEKPLATSLADARRLVSESLRMNVVLMVGHVFEFNPAVREMKRRMQQGELGTIYYIHSARLNLGVYRSDVNVVWDLAPHDVSILNYLLGSQPTTVSAWGSINACAGVEDLAYIRLDYGDLGVTGYVHLSWLDPRKVRKVMVVGSKKMAVYDDLAEERLRIFDRGVDGADLPAASHERPLTYRYGDIVAPHIRFEEPLALEDRHFLDSIRAGSAPQTDGWNGLAVVAVLEAISASLRTGTTVKVELPAAADAASLQRQMGAQG